MLRGKSVTFQATEHGDLYCISEATRQAANAKVQSPDYHTLQRPMRFGNGECTVSEPPPSMLNFGRKALCP